MSRSLTRTITTYNPCSLSSVLMFAYHSSFSGNNFRSTIHSSHVLRMIQQNENTMEYPVIVVIVVQASHTDDCSCCNTPNAFFVFSVKIFSNINHDGRFAVTRFFSFERSIQLRFFRRKVSSLIFGLWGRTPSQSVWTIAGLSNTLLIHFLCGACLAFSEFVLKYI